MNKVKEEKKNTTPWKDFWSVVWRKNKTTENNRAVTGFFCGEAVCSGQHHIIIIIIIIDYDYYC